MTAFYWSFECMGVLYSVIQLWHFSLFLQTLFDFSLNMFSWLTIVLLPLQSSKYNLLHWNNVTIWSYRNFPHLNCECTWDLDLHMVLVHCSMWKAFGPGIFIVMHSILVLNILFLALMGTIVRFYHFFNCKKSLYQTQQSTFTSALL